MCTSSLVIVASQSKWPGGERYFQNINNEDYQEVFIFISSYALHQQVVIDNGTLFIAVGFDIFMNCTSLSPYHPSSYETVEQFNRTLKLFLCQVKEIKGSFPISLHTPFKVSFHSSCNNQQISQLPPSSTSISYSNIIPSYNAVEKASDKQAN